MLFELICIDLSYYYLNISFLHYKKINPPQNKRRIPTELNTNSMYVHVL
jgi:hypothetical protein